MLKSSVTIYIIAKVNVKILNNLNYNIVVYVLIFEYKNLNIKFVTI